MDSESKKKKVEELAKILFSWKGELAEKMHQAKGYTLAKYHDFSKKEPLRCFLTGNPIRSYDAIQFRYGKGRGDFVMVSEKVLDKYSREELSDELFRFGLRANYKAERLDDVLSKEDIDSGLEDARVYRNPHSGFSSNPKRLKEYPGLVERLNSRSYDVFHEG
ncbi:MAG: hypothetical protein ACLFPQ_04035 [Candidatus Woesearchaeota archaeon]